MYHTIVGRESTVTPMLGHYHQNLGNYRSYLLRIDRREHGRLERYAAWFTERVRDRFAIAKARHAYFETHPVDPYQRSALEAPVCLTTARNDMQIVHRLKPVSPIEETYRRYPARLRLAFSRAATYMVRTSQVDRLARGPLRWFYLERGSWSVVDGGIRLTDSPDEPPIRLDDPRAARILARAIPSQAMVYQRDGRWYLLVYAPNDQPSFYEPRMLLGYVYHQDGLVIRSDGRVYEPGWVRKFRRLHAGADPGGDPRRSVVVAQNPVRRFIRYASHHIANRILHEVLQDGVIPLFYHPRKLQTRRSPRIQSVRHAFQRESIALSMGLLPWNFRELHQRIEQRLTQASVIADFIPHCPQWSNRPNIETNLVAVCPCGQPLTEKALFLGPRCPGCKRRFDPAVRRAYEVSYFFWREGLNPLWAIPIEDDPVCDDELETRSARHWVEPPPVVRWSPEPPFRGLFQE